MFIHKLSNISYIIHNIQTGYLQGMFIRENIWFISDILHYTVDQNLEGIGLFIDFEKVFNSLEWEYLIKALDTFNFGQGVKAWANTLHNNISSSTVNNGFVSNSFKLKRGGKQGCSLSRLLFVLAVELLSCSIKASTEVRNDLCSEFSI